MPQPAWGAAKAALHSAGGSSRTASAAPGLPLPAGGAAAGVNGTTRRQHQQQRMLQHMRDMSVHMDAGWAATLDDGACGSFPLRAGADRSGRAPSQWRRLDALRPRLPRLLLVWSCRRRQPSS